MLINGKVVDAASGKTFPTYNPATGEVLAHIAEGDREDIDRAVKAARAAFENRPVVEADSFRARTTHLEAADLLEEISRVRDVGTLDNGKPLKIARGADVPLAVDLFRYMADGPPKIEGTTIPISVPYTPGAKYLAYTNAIP